MCLTVKPLCVSINTLISLCLCSSNILLDGHMMARLADFGLAKFASHRPENHKASKTSTIGQTATIRGTLAYLPDEYVRNGKLGTALDVYSFGVVRHCGKCCLLVQTKELFRFRRSLFQKGVI